MSNVATTVQDVVFLSTGQEGRARMGREVEVLKFEHCPTLFTLCKPRKKKVLLRPKFYSNTSPSSAWVGSVNRSNNVLNAVYLEYL